MFNLNVMLIYNYFSMFFRFNFWLLNKNNYIFLSFSLIFLFIHFGVFEDSQNIFIDFWSPYESIYFAAWKLQRSQNMV